MQTLASPYGNEAGLIARYIGTGYENVKVVADAIQEVIHLSDNMSVVFDFVASKEAFEAFILNPDFLQFLTDNTENFSDLAALISDMSVSYTTKNDPEFTGMVTLGSRAVKKEEIYFTGTTPVVGSTNLQTHTLDASKIISITGAIHKVDGTVEAISSISGSPLRVICDADYLRVTTHADSVGYASRPFDVTVTVKE